MLKYKLNSLTKIKNNKNKTKIIIILPKISTPEVYFMDDEIWIVMHHVTVSTVHSKYVFHKFIISVVYADDNKYNIGFDIKHEIWFVNC